MPGLCFFVVVKKAPLYGELAILRLLVTLAATFPINGDSFWVFIYSAYVFFTISISSSHIFSRLWMLMNSLLPWKL